MTEGDYQILALVIAFYVTHALFFFSFVFNESSSLLVSAVGNYSTGIS